VLEFAKVAENQNNML